MGLSNSKVIRDKFPFFFNNKGSESKRSNKNGPDKFRFENGKRYHNVENSTYFLPNDNDECDRLQLQHFIERYIWQDNFFAPVNHLLNQEGTMVLDVGTGPGTWLLEMATNYPKSKFIGIDISPVQPNTIKPKNAEFIEGNVLKHLPFPDDTFNYVFQRFLNVGIPEKSWPSVINELVRVLKPGGYIELLEVEVLFNKMGPATARLMDGILIIFGENGLDQMTCHKLQGFLEGHRQLHDVHSEIKKSIDNEDSEKLYKLMYENYATGLISLKPKLMNIIGASSNEYDDLIKKMGNEIIELESFSLRVRVYAQKLNTANSDA
ncbi:1426_t:CDS:2 [Cetraspora pellucida]|uniref:1426_t:CDS:1 n=1 Tax=Cetraspora pellucida TaxID=1433469 RepID=A0A9N9DH42_9GLOM|nr:1426_t:CDS:2 [Cetraspora pellucida]